MQLTVAFDDLTFPLCHVINPTGVDLMTGTEQTFPSAWTSISSVGLLRASRATLPSHRIGTNYRAEGNQLRLIPSLHRTYWVALNSMPVFSGAPLSSSINSTPCSFATLLKAG